MITALYAYVTYVTNLMIFFDINQRGIRVRSVDVTFSYVTNKSAVERNPSFLIPRIINRRLVSRPMPA